jgi:hypothetical protein
VISCGYVDKFDLDSHGVPRHLRIVMTILREGDLLSAAGSLCRAADDLRAIGLLHLAEEIDSFIAMLDAEILLGTLVDE